MESSAFVGVKYNGGGGSSGRNKGFHEDDELRRLGKVSSTAIPQPPECDSTITSTSSSSRNTDKFKVGEDVYYQDDDSGQNVFGAVGMIQGKKIKVIFMDGTEKWTTASKIKKLTCSLSDDLLEEEAEMSGNADVCTATSSSGSKKKSKVDLNKESCQVTCGSCGTQKMITGKKAQSYSPYTSHQFNCRKCINKSKTSKNNGVPSMIAAHYLAAAAAQQQARGNRQSNKEMTPAGINKRTSDGHISNSSSSTSSSTNHVHHRVQEPSLSPNVCLHCRSPINENVSLHCTMCERPCHPSCLALTPSPLPGDIFWSIICQVCGTQQRPDGSTDNDNHKLYSSRRSITCWSDVAYLLLSCMGCMNPTERFFDLDTQILPFWDNYQNNLHLPRQYKQSDKLERRRSLLVALNNASLRFLKDDRRKPPLFAIKDQTTYNRCLNVVIKPNTNGQQQQSRNVTAAGFPIQVRATNNPEATSVSMSTIAASIAANKTLIATPKNSPNNVSPKFNANNVQQQLTNKRVVVQQQSHNVDDNNVQQVAKKTTPMQPVMIRKYKKKEVTPPPTQSQKQKLTPSSGGSARVTGMERANLTPSNSTSPQVNSNSNILHNSSPARFNSNCSFPVRKNGSPILNLMSKSVMVESIVGGITKSTSNGESTSSSKSIVVLRSDQDKSDVLSNSNNRLAVKRKLSSSIEDHASVNSNFQQVKKVKLLSLPSSTELTTKLSVTPSPQKTPGSPQSSSSSNSSVKPTLSPMQKLSDLQRNGGLTVACIKGNNLMNEAGNGSSRMDNLWNDNRVECTPRIGEVEQSRKDTKEISGNNVTEFKKQLSPLMQQGKIGGTNNARPVRLKRSVVANKSEDGKGKKTEGLVLNKSKKTPATTTAAAAAALVAKSRGRPKKLFMRRGGARRAPTFVDSYNQFNGAAVVKDKGGDAETGESSNGLVDECKFRWGSSTVDDLIRFGVGVRVSVLPEYNEADALRFLKSEVGPKPPTYWERNVGKKRDLKDLESYFVCGRRILMDGREEYQVVWGGGEDVEEDDQDESGISFQDYDFLEYFFDCLPVCGEDGKRKKRESVEIFKTEEQEDVPPPVIDLTDSS